MLGSETELDELNASILTEVLPTFERLSPEARQRLLRTIATFFGIAPGRVAISGDVQHSLFTSEVGSDSNGSFSTDKSISAKEFIFQKQPRSDVERVACLAYYLTHYRDVPHFKTVDLSKLNTEAAQPKFANAAWVVNNATKRGYLVTATKGNKQLSAAGEQFVQALPDRDAARMAMERALPRRKQKKQTQKPHVDS